MSATPSVNKRFSWTAYWAALHAALAAVLVTALVLYVPPAKKRFDEFGLMLPGVSLAVIKASGWVVEHLVVVLAALAGLAVGNFAVMRACDPCCPGARTAWILGLTLLLVAAGFAVGYGVEYPQMKLREGLAK